MQKKYFKPSELKDMGYPYERVMELCRSGRIGFKSSDSKRGFHYLVELWEVEEHLRRNK